MVDKSIISQVYTRKGKNLYDLSAENPVLLVFLRHFGCIFCREALKDISNIQTEIGNRKVNVILVHMGAEDIADDFFEKYALQNYDSISDPETRIYNQFGLGKGNFNQLFGLKSFIRGFEATMSGTMISLKQIGDGFQMPGVFLLHNGTIHGSYIHNTAADKPDYLALIDNYLSKHN